mgnify:CR=1 FL=1
MRLYAAGEGFCSRGHALKRYKSKKEGYNLKEFGKEYSLRTVTLSVFPGEDGKTVGQTIEGRLSISSRLLAELKRKNGILKNGVPVTVREGVSAGDTVSICLFEEAPSERIVPEDIPLTVLYEDEDILAVSKPKNMPIHPSLHHYTGTLGNAVLYRYRDEPFVFRPITRLDIDTTGIVLIARNRLSAQILSEQMQKGEIRKTYFALLSKTPPQKEGLIDAPIGRSGESIIKREVRPDGKAAVTAYSIRRENPDGTCVAEVRPLTGRTHQIRVHMAHIGCPLLYDYLYGTEVAGETLYLHCGRLSFTHPLTGKVLTIKSEPRFL